jgi:Cys-tRNA synthase (O-phospho-L-seryl-tRNA:Cys-tRNA synthase)
MYPKIMVIKPCFHESGKEVRDHVWIKITDEIEKLIPRSNKNRRRVSFICETYKYRGENGYKTGMRNVKDFKLMTYCIKQNKWVI